MAGHNKWSKVKHIKAKTDAQKGKAFSKVGREIMMAAKQGGGDPEMNPSLRLALLKARQVNMPKDNIKRAIEKGVGGGDDSNYEAIMYEAYGPNGVGLIIETLTDNKNRTVPNIRAILSKAGGSLANQGSVAYLFDKRGVLLFDDTSNHDTVMDTATEAGAEDIILHDDGSLEVRTEVSDFDAVSRALDEKQLTVLSSALAYIPQTTVALEEHDARKLLNLIDKLDEDDDVQQVSANYAIDDAVIDRIMGEET